MSHVFISYARSTARQAQQVAAVLRELGFHVWLDDAIPAHRAYADVGLIGAVSGGQGADKAAVRQRIQAAAGRARPTPSKRPA